MSCRAARGSGSARGAGRDVPAPTRDAKNSLKTSRPEAWTIVTDAVKPNPSSASRTMPARPRDRFRRPDATLATAHAPGARFCRTSSAPLRRSGHRAGCPTQGVLGSGAAGRQFRRNYAVIGNGAAVTAPTRTIAVQVSTEPAQLRSLNNSDAPSRRQRLVDKYGARKKRRPRGTALVIEPRNLRAALSDDGRSSRGQEWVAAPVAVTAPKRGAARRRARLSPGQCRGLRAFSVQARRTPPSRSQSER